MAILNQLSSSLRMKTLKKSSVSFKVVIDEAELLWNAAGLAKSGCEYQTQPLID
jgi:hypothetical protein